MPLCDSSSDVDADAKRRDTGSLGSWGSDYAIRMQRHADEIETCTRAQCVDSNELSSEVTEIGLGAHEVFALVQELRRRMPTVEFYGVWDALAPGKKRKLHKPQSAIVVSRRVDSDCGGRLEQTQRDHYDALLLCSGVCEPALESEAALSKAEGMFALAFMFAALYTYVIMLASSVNKLNAVAWSALVSKWLGTAVSAHTVVCVGVSISAVLAAITVALWRRVVPLRKRVCEVKQDDSPACVAWHARVLAEHADAERVLAAANAVPSKNEVARASGAGREPVRARAKRAT